MQRTKSAWCCRSCVFSPLFWKNFCMYKGGKFHWVDLLFQENSIKIVIRLTGYFLLRPLMNEPLISENLTSHLGGCVSVYVCRYVCVCMCVSSAMVFQIFSWRKGQSQEWMRLEKGKEREERRGHSRLCQFTVVAFHWDGILLGLILYLRSHSFTGKTEKEKHTNTQHKTRHNRINLHRVWGNYSKGEGAVL